MARLTDEPARHLLVVIDEGQPDEAEPSVQASSPGEAPSPVAASATPGQADRHHDHWYFSSDDDTATRTAVAAPPPVSDTAGSDAATEPKAPEPQAVASEATPIETADEDQHPQRAPAPVRFVWRTDAEGKFSTVSPEFAEAVGQPAADVVGRRFRDVASAFGLDPSGEVAGLLERRDTWSGRSVLWPLAGTELKVPVDLAALPVYSRSREFEGFRGFGVARMADAIADPERIGLALVPNQPQPAPEPASPESPPETAAPSPFHGSDPFQGEVPALEISPQPERRFADKVIRLAEHRSPAHERALSTLERSAFREIGERLRRENRTEPAPVAPATEAAPPAPVPSSVSGKAEDTGKLAGSDSETSSASLQAEGEPAEPVARGSLLDYAAEGPDGIADDDSIAAADFRDARDDGDLMPPTPSEPVAEPAPPARPAPLPPLAGSFLPSAFATGASDISILAKLPVPLLIHSGDILHYANDEFLDLAGYDTLDELEAAGGLDALFVETYADEAADEADRALRLRSRDGSEFPVEAILRSVPWQDRKALLLVVRRTGDNHAPGEADVTVPQVAAGGSQQPETQELKARLAEMRTIIDTATDGVVLIGRDGNIRSISRPAEALFGFDSEDVNGKPFASLFAIESQRAARDYLAGLTEHGVASVLNDGREVIGREAQGRFIPLFMTIGRLPGDSGFCAVVRDITQWKRAEEDLTQARAVAERASSQKTDFLARISHEIRTPLNAIIGFSELMVDEKFGPVANDRYRDYLRDINRSGNHVLDLVNDLLDISKIEAGQQDMDYEAVSLNDTLAETVALMQPQANRERVIIRSSFASRLPEVVADLRSVRQIALNILSNAIRYTQAGGQVIVSTAYEISGDVVLRVRDTGIGMTQAEIEQALKPFKQINALKRGRGDGTGLGLPLTKAMVEANRARFTISSTPGEGTLVEVAFPSTRVLAE
jgi:PAS domain S-box-containing protein